MASPSQRLTFRLTIIAYGQLKFHVELIIDKFFSYTSTFSSAKPISVNSHVNIHQYNYSERQTQVFTGDP